MGGTWTSQNKVRPGTYVNVSAAEVNPELNNAGVVAMGLDLSFGDERTVVEITKSTDTLPIFGYYLEDIVPLNEALKRGTKVLAYRLNANTGDKATVTTGNLTATAKYTGTRGNDLDVVIVDVGGGDFRVDSYLGTILVDTQTTDTVDNLVANDYIDFSGTGVLAATAGVSLASGTDETVDAAAHTAFRTAIETYEFNVIALYDETDSGIKASYKSFIQELRDSQGVKVQLVAENYLADYEGVVSVKNGVVLSDGTSLTAAKCTAYIAGAIAKAYDTGNSLTYDVYDGAVDTVTKYTNAQIETAIEAGEMLFRVKNGVVKIEYDINTLVTYTSEKTATFSKGRIVRTLDKLNNDIVDIGEDYVIGKIDNNGVGRSTYRSMIIKVIDEYTNKGLITNFDPSTDIIVSAGTAVDAVVVGLAIQPVDSIDKVYMTITVN